jgi:hypothetical protein
MELIHFAFDGDTENVDSLHHLLRAYVAWNRSTIEPDRGFQRFPLLTVGYMRSKVLQAYNVEQ